MPGIPARVVTGWSIGQAEQTQIVFSDQAHQWAEVPFEGLGWVTFEPTAFGGAPSRTPTHSQTADSAGSMPLETLIKTLADRDSNVRKAAVDALAELGGEAAIDPLSQAALHDEDPAVRQAAVDALAELGGPAAMEPLVQALSDADTAVSGAAQETLTELGASVTDLESGGTLVTRNGSDWWVPGSTTSQAGELPHEPVFEVQGASRTGYLRTATGDIYENGRWRQIDPVSIESNASDLPDKVSSQIESWPMPKHRLDPSLLVLRDPNRDGFDDIFVSPAGEAKHIPAGVVPIALRVSRIGPIGYYRPFSATVSTEKPVDGYG